MQHAVQLSHGASKKLTRNSAECSVIHLDIWTSNEMTDEIADQASRRRWMLAMQIDIEDGTVYPINHEPPISTIAESRIT